MKKCNMPYTHCGLGPRWNAFCKFSLNLNNNLVKHLLLPLLWSKTLDISWAQS